MMHILLSIYSFVGTVLFVLSMWLNHRNQVIKAVMCNTLAVLTWPLLLLAVCGLAIRYYIAHKAPFRIINNGELYLSRFYLTPLKWVQRVFLHKISRPDQARHPHDHPWPFWTIILRGSYREEVYEGTRLLYARTVKAGDIVFREATHTHKITHILGNGPAWTLVFAAQARRVWGFWVEMEGSVFNTPCVFVPWNVYLKDATPLAEDVVPTHYFMIDADCGGPVAGYKDGP